VWLERHHADTPALAVGFHRKRSGKPSITWAEAVDEALCYGWIDGVRRGLDGDSYTIRFTPRRPRSTWSAVNIERARELKRSGRMQPAGLKAFAARTDERSAIYAYEQRRGAKLDSEQERRFRANEAAWEFFSAQPPSYRRTATWWIVSAKREETRVRRLATLIEDSANRRRIKALTRREST
jgi:uncharacterized protein YdeI (YjbR/CyaY-like superfamily)